MRAKIAIALVVVLMLSLTACGGEKGIVGKWVDKVNGVENTMEFNKDGTGKMGVAGLMNLDFTYVDKGDKVVIILMGQEVPYDYTLDGDKLTLVADGVPETFTRD